MEATYALVGFGVPKGVDMGFFAFAGVFSALGVLVAIVGAFLADTGFVPEFVPEAGVYMLIAGIGLLITGCWPGKPMARRRVRQ